MKLQLNGLVAAPHTPFHEDTSLAPEVVELQAAHLKKNGIRFAFITGSTGEAMSLTRDERLQIFDAWAAAGPRHEIRVVAHVGSNCLEDSKVFSAAAAGCGMEAVAAFAPSYFKPGTVEVLVEWCAAIAAAAPQLPFYYYDIPTMTGVKFPTQDFVTRAIDRIPNFHGIKFTKDDLDAYRYCVNLGTLDVPWGIDEKLIDALQAGSRGAVGSSYNFAAPLYHELITAFQAGDLQKAQELQDRSIRMIDALAQIGYLGAAKAVMAWQGVPVGPARLPNTNPDKFQLDQLRATLGKIVELAPGHHD